MSNPFLLTTILNNKGEYGMKRLDSELVEKIGYNTEIIVELAKKII